MSDIMRDSFCTCTEYVDKLLQIYMMLNTPSRPCNKCNCSSSPHYLYLLLYSNPFCIFIYSNVVSDDHISNM